MFGNWTYHLQTNNQLADNDAHGYPDQSGK